MTSWRKNLKSSRAALIIIQTLVGLTAFFVFALSVCIVRGDFPDQRKLLKKIPVLSKIIDERDTIQRRSKIINLNYSIPSFDPLAQLFFQPEQLTKGPPFNYNRYLQYYQKVVEAIPSEAHAYGMLGYCYDGMGQYQKAIESFEKAAFLQPDFFWFPYNIGIVSLKTGDYPKALAAFSTALKKNPETVLGLTVQSTVYRQISASYTGDSSVKALGQRLMNAYQNCQKLMIAVAQQVNSGNPNPAVFQNLRTAIF